MSTTMRVRTVVAAALCAAALSSATAQATTPDPYATAAGTGQVATTTILGQSACDLTAVTATIANNAGSITGFTSSNCAGIITSMAYSLVINIAINLAIAHPGVTLTVTGVNITNALGGTCLYAGTLTGQGADGTGIVMASGTVALNRSRSSGFCSDPANVRLNLNFPGLTL